MFSEVQQREVRFNQPGIPAVRQRSTTSQAPEIDSQTSESENQGQVEATIENES